MKRIIIIGEGQTEQSFCNDVLQSHFNSKGILIQNPVIKKTHGGIVNWEALKYQIETHLRQDQGCTVSTMIDYYGIHRHHKYPLWEEAEKLTDKNVRMDMLEAGLLSEVDPELRRRFIPYIQLHEFESLLFSDLDVYNNNFEAEEFLNYNYLLETIDQYDNPELINNGINTAPSKRLAKIIKGYFSENENQKVLYGTLLAQDIGLQKIRSKCPRFNDWIIKLEAV